MDQLGVFLGGLGVGSIITTLLDHIFARRAWTRSTRFNERRDAFAGLLAAIAVLDREGDDPSSRALADVCMWEARVQLVGSKDVRAFVANWRDTEPSTHERIDRVRAMLEAMRCDLGFAE